METSSNFIENIGDTKTFNNLTEFNDFFRNKDFSKEARKRNYLAEDQGERMVLYLYLYLLLKNELHLSFPIKITKSERPDFLLDINEKKIGLEVTNATTQEIMADRAQIKRNSNLKGIVFTSFGHQVIKNCDPLPGAGIYDLQSENMYRDLILGAIEDKSKKLNETNYNRFNYNELLIYDRYVLSLTLKNKRGFVELCEIVKESINDFTKQTQFKYYFDSISFFMQDRLLFNMNGNYQIINK